jgi:hypothetical protein
MTQRFDVVRRLEPLPRVRDLDRGFAAEVSDPAWFLGRQWRMGEHQGENASSAVLVTAQVASAPLGPIDGRPGDDPARVPGEAFVEGEPDDWWTPRRRIEVGRRCAGVLVGAHPEVRCQDLPPPYDRFNASASGPGEIDGRLAWIHRVALGLPDALFADVPAFRASMWRPPELTYDASIPVGGGRLLVQGHRGGEIDWWSAELVGPSSEVTVASATAVPTRLTFPGAPQPRWWQIEDHTVDIAGFPPDASHLGTMFLIDLICGHSNDWLVFPVAAVAATVVGLPQATITDGFGRSYDAAPPKDWALQRVSAHADSAFGPAPLLVPLGAVTPLVGEDVDEVVVGVDEEANVLWAVERRVAGVARVVDADEISAGRTQPVDKVATGPVDYQPSSPLPKGWFPYTLSEPWLRFVPHRLADLRSDVPTPLLPPQSPFLTDDRGREPAYFELAPHAIPSSGLKLTRRFVLGRALDGRPVLWQRRRAVALSGPPGKPLLFDVVEG